MYYMSVLTINTSNFEAEVLNSPKPVLLDFWAAWCQPCLMIAPIIDEIAAEQNAVRVGKVNVEEAPELAEMFGIASIPLVVLMKDGNAVAQAEGYRPNQKAVLLEMMAPYMK